MSIQLDVLVEVAPFSRRYVVRVIAGVEEEDHLYPCHHCGRGQTRKIQLIALSVTRVTTDRGLMPSLLTWLDAVYEAEEQLGAGKPVCINCWDEAELHRLAYLARKP
jgi:hypothetical protein